MKVKQEPSTSVLPWGSQGLVETFLHAACCPANAFWLVSANHDAGSALSVNHLPSGVLIFAVSSAFRQWRPSRTVAIGSDTHLVLLLPAADSPSQGDRPAGARPDRCTCAEAPAPAAQAARLRKRVYWGSNSSFTVPTGPLRCLVTMTSVMPRSGVSGL